MVEFRIKINPEQRLAYIPKELYAVLGSHLKATPNRAAVLLYPEEMPLSEVMKSLDIIRQDLEHAVGLSKGKEPRKEESQHTGKTKQGVL